MVEGTRVAYQILHYNTVDDTNECVRSIREFSESPIVIVCNGSINESDTAINNIYKDNKTIHVILSRTNVGFARGNNIGFDYIRQNNIADIIVCINNDIVIEDSNFESIIIDEYITSQYGVGGVDVINPYGVHCNPRYENWPTEKSVEATIKSFEKAVRRCSRFGGLEEILYAACQRIKRKIGGSNKGYVEKQIMTLHGCCMIFTPVFFHCFSGLHPETYLYGEEIILSYQCAKADIPMKYIRNTFVLHNEAKATKQEFKRTVKRHLFYYTNILESTKVLKKIIQG